MAPVVVAVVVPPAVADWLGQPSWVVVLQLTTFIFLLERKKSNDKTDEVLFFCCFFLFRNLSFDCSDKNTLFLQWKLNQYMIIEKR